MPDKIKTEAQRQREKELRRMNREISEDEGYELTPKEKAALKLSNLRRTYLDD